MTTDRTLPSGESLADPLAGFRITVVPHTHWDREWYEPVAVLRDRMASMIDDLLDTLEADPAFRTFTLDGQSVLLEDYAAVRPERVPQLRRLLGSGRLQVGPAYVLPDEYLASQEALVRNLVVGMATCREAGGRPMSVGYHPDTFGHVAQLPQILAGFGLDAFLFWRGLGDEANRVGVAFDWEAPDGTRVLAVRQLGGYANGARIGRWGSGGIDLEARPELWPAVTAQRLVRQAEVFAPELDRTGVRELLISNGSDHEGVHRRLPALLASARRRHRDTSISIATFPEYVRRLRATMADPLPVVLGELCGGRDAPVLRGVNSTRMWLKQEAERVERHLLETETLAALALLAGRTVPATHARLDAAWRAHLQDLPHDSISGCAIDQVSHDMAARWDRALDITADLAADAIAALAHDRGRRADEEDPSHVRDAINVLGHPRHEVVTIDLPPRSIGRPLSAADGAPVQPSRRHPGNAFVAVDLPPFGVAPIVLRDAPPTTPPADAVHVVGRSMWNERLEVAVAHDGTLTLVDRRSGEQASGLASFEDLADRGDTYTFCPVEGDRPVRSRGEGFRVEVVERGPLIGELELRGSLRLPARLAVDRRRRVGSAVIPIRLRVRLAAGSSAIELLVDLENRAEDHRLRLLFPAPATTFRSAVRAEGHFAVLRRPPRPIWSWAGWLEPPAPTHHTSGFVAAGDLWVAGQGLPEYESLVGEDGCQTLAITLLRCVGQLSRDDLSTRPGGAGPSLPTPEAQCRGPFRARIVVGLGASRSTDAELVRAWSSARFQPLLAPPGTTMPTLALRGDVALSALKPTEDGMDAVLRCYNPGSESVSMTVEWAGEQRVVRLDERPVDPPPPEWLRGGEIRSVRLVAPDRKALRGDAEEGVPPAT